VTKQFPNITGSGELLLAILQSICGDASGKSMIDLCCNQAPYTPRLGFSQRTYLDIQDRPLDHHGEQRFFVRGNALDASGHYDVSLCIDGIEHFAKEDGLKLLRVMDAISHKQILFTPLGLPPSIDGAKYDAHLSAW